MNREIKFRAWDVSGACWIPETEWLIGSDGKLYTWHNREKRFVEETIKYIICQFTGLKDKNGKEIYEGDILSPGFREVRFGDFISLDEDGTPFSQGNGFYTIAHELTLRPMPFSFAHRQSEGCEIIGNKFEHPELLEAK